MNEKGGSRNWWWMLRLAAIAVLSPVEVPAHKAKPRNLRLQRFGRDAVVATLTAALVGGVLLAAELRYVDSVNNATRLAENLRFVRSVAVEHVT